MTRRETDPAAKALTFTDDAVWWMVPTSQMFDSFAGCTQYDTASFEMNSGSS